MSAIYGHKWTSQYGKKVDRTWRRAMQALPVGRLKFALARCGNFGDGWPPSLTEFLALAQVLPEELGAPNVDHAFSEACRGAYPFSGWHRWSHKCVYWAATWTGLSDLNERPNANRKKFEREYQRALDTAETLKEPPSGALPDRPSVIDPDISGEGFQSFLKAKKNILGVKEDKK